jgi:Fe-S cluster biogenesis protein NfuA
MVEPGSAGQDRAWEARVRSVIGTLVRPLVTDGGVFAVRSCDPVARSVVVQADFGSCEACAMSEEDLASLLTEGVRRAVDPASSVEVVAAG